jgi:hypothetical protein
MKVALKVTNRNLDRRVCSTTAHSAGLSSAASRWGSRAPRRGWIDRPPHSALPRLRVGSIGGLYTGTDCLHAAVAATNRLGTTMTTIAMVILTQGGLPSWQLLL